MTEGTFFTAYRAGLHTRTLGQALELHPVLSSTNAYIKTRVKAQNAPTGLAVIALRQTAGRGRLGRDWSSEPGAGLYLSFLTGALPPQVLPLVPLVTGVAVADALAAVCGVSAGIKWPNDIIVERRKLCGILCEGAAGGVVIGIGVNLSQDAAFFESAGLPNATSLLMEAGAAPDMPTLAAAIANALETGLDRLEAGEVPEILTRLRQLCVTLGREVLATGPAAQIRGTAVDIDAAGRLVVDTGRERIPISAGEVQLRTPEGYV